MKIRQIAMEGLKGRKRDTLLLKIVIILSFTFIIAAMIFQSSSNQTKIKTRYELYGQWDSVYLHADEEIIQELEETKPRQLVASKIIGTSEKLGMVGVINEELVDLGNMTLYKGRFPETDNEIVIELERLIAMGLEPEVGQTVSAVINMVLLDDSVMEYLSNAELTNTRFGSYPNYNLYHETPSEYVGDILFVASTDIVYLYEAGVTSSPEDIRNNGKIYHQKATIKKDFVVTGILNTYSQNWDVGQHELPNAYITQSSSNQIEDAFYQTNILNTKDYEFRSHVYMKMEDDIKIKELEERYRGHTGIEKGYSQLYEDLSLYSHRYSKERIFNERYENFYFPPHKINDIKTNMHPGVLSEGYGLEVEELFYFLQATNGLSFNPTMENGVRNLTSQYRHNLFAYPTTEGSKDNILTITIVGIIFLATTCAVFQIFLTQMKRRTRKLVLLKSIGATNLQVIKLILWEALYFFGHGLLFGGFFGVIISFITIQMMNYWNPIEFHVSYSLVSLGLGAGSLALFIGILIPVFISLRVPLIGTMSKPPKHKIMKHRNISKVKLNRHQTFDSISFEYFKYNKVKTLLPFALSTFILSIALISLLLSFFAFSTYIDTVHIKKRPDYTIQAIYGEMRKKIPARIDDILEIEGVDHVYAYKIGKNAMLWYDKIQENKRIQSFNKILPTNISAQHNNQARTDLDNWPSSITDAFFTKVYGIDTNTSLYQSFLNNISVGNLEQEKFESGEEVILLIPLYLELDPVEKFSISNLLPITTQENRMSILLKEAGLYQLSFDEEYFEIAQRETSIQVGDTITVSADHETVIKDDKIISFEIKETKVGGIIYYMGNEGIWPFTNDVMPYTVIGSYAFMESVYPASKIGLFHYSIDDMRNMTQTMYKTKYGTTQWNVYSKSEEGEVLDSKLLAYANDNGHQLLNYRINNNELLTKALTNTLVIGLLGVTTILIAFIILYNTLISKVEQEQNRIGILQSIGITQEQFKKHYLKIGIIQGVVGILVSHLLCFCILVGFTLQGMGENPKTITTIGYRMINSTMYLYPWLLHGIISILFLVFVIVINYRSPRKIIRNLPIDNIRSLNQ